jgi:FtsH-binding integral membrane protein
MEWILSHIPTWWWYGLIGFTLVSWVLSKGESIVLMAFGYIMISFGLLCLYGLWLMSFGWFFDSPLDMPWWCWVIALFAGGPPTATFLVTIRKV